MEPSHQRTSSYPTLLDSFFNECHSLETVTLFEIDTKALQSASDNKHSLEFCHRMLPRASRRALGIETMESFRHKIFASTRLSTNEDESMFRLGTQKVETESTLPYTTTFTLVKVRNSDESNVVQWE